MNKYIIQAVAQLGALLNQDAPTSLTVVALTNASIKLDWVNASGQDGVSIERSADGLTGWSEIATVDVGQTYTNTGLTANHYYYRLRAYKGDLYSSYTAIVSNELPLTLLTSTSTYRYNYKEADYITKDADFVISALKNIVGDANADLAQIATSGPTVYPEFIRFVNRGMVKAFTLAQPIYIYMVMMQDTWTVNTCMVDGIQEMRGQIRCHTTSQPRICVAGSASLSTYSEDAPVGKWVIVRALFNGASSKFIVNNLTPITGSWGGAAMNGLTIGCKGGGTNANNAQFSLKDIVVRNVADSAQNEADIYNYLKNLYGIDDYAFDNGKLVLTFDDGNLDNYTNALPLLVSKGVAATFYLISGVVGTTGYMTWANAKAMHDAGMDMESHTHGHAYLTTLTQEQIENDAALSVAAFEANNLPAPQHIAYPYGDHNVKVLNYLAPTYKTGRVVPANVSAFNPKYIFKNSTKLNLPPAVATDNIDAAGITALKAKMDIVQSNKYGLILYGHKVAAVADAGTTSLAVLGDIIDYALSIGMDVITVKQLHSIMQP